jgi:ATP-dependent Clp protease ATP-binding subunit ClpA
MCVSVSGQRICRLAEEASAAATPDEALRTLRTLREELVEFERQHVARALTLGEPVTAVATALGVSRQSAHRRFRDLVPPRARAERLRATPEVHLAVEYARREASRQGAPSVGSVHLLLGILRSGDSETVQALDALGVTIDAAREAAVQLDTSDGLAAEHRAALGQALRLALREQAEMIGLRHILAGVLHDPTAGAMSVIRALGVTPEQARGAVRACAARA